mmetsp:Transcript_86572/g.225895  ORF Transcript_86572/g.225895 Transcript_86572/m.225895 type:complete len:216 (-) Transcript_86572:1581-2228(-)
MTNKKQGEQYTLRMRGVWSPVALTECGHRQTAGRRKRPGEVYRTVLPPRPPSGGRRSRQRSAPPSRRGRQTRVRQRRGGRAGRRGRPASQAAAGRQWAPHAAQPHRASATNPTGAAKTTARPAPPFSCPSPLLPGGPSWPRSAPSASRAAAALATASLRAPAASAATARALVGTTTVAVRASWSLPAPPRFLLSVKLAFPVLAKMLSMPPKDSPW